MNVKRIALPPGSRLRRPPRALLGYACLDDTFLVNRMWYPVADWRSWRHGEVVEAFRHSGIEGTGLGLEQYVSFHTPAGALVGYARVTAVRMSNSSSLTRDEVAALDYDEDEYQEFLHFENEAGWYVVLERVEVE